jgi:hypothetical protein
MFENFIFPFFIGFLIVIIPIALYGLFYFFLLLTLGAWDNFEKADSLRKKAINLILFFVIQLIIIINSYYFIGTEFLDSLDVNSKQVLSSYCGFVIFLILTRKTFGHKILKAKILSEE